MTKAYYSAILDYPLATVWSLIRDFNNYPAYIDGVTESVIEDDKGGDQVGAIRRFCYLSNWIRQRPGRPFRCAAHPDLRRHGAVSVPDGFTGSPITDALRRHHAAARGCPREPDLN